MMKFRDCNPYALFLEMFGLCQFLINLYFLAYEMDKTSRYKPGNVKRQEKQVRAESIRNLPKITQWIQLQSVSEPEESHSGTPVTTEKISQLT